MHGRRDDTCCRGSSLSSWLSAARCASLALSDSAAAYRPPARRMQERLVHAWGRACRRWSAPADTAQTEAPTLAPAGHDIGHEAGVRAGSAIGQAGLHEGLQAGRGACGQQRRHDGCQHAHVIHCPVLCGRLGDAEVRAQRPLRRCSQSAACCRLHMAKTPHRSARVGAAQALTWLKPGPWGACSSLRTLLASWQVSRKCQSDGSRRPERANSAAIHGTSKALPLCAIRTGTVSSAEQCRATKSRNCCATSLHSSIAQSSGTKPRYMLGKAAGAYLIVGRLGSWTICVEMPCTLVVSLGTCVQACMAD